MEIIPVWKSQSILQPRVVTTPSVADFSCSFPINVNETSTAIVLHMGREHTLKLLNGNERREWICGDSPEEEKCQGKKCQME